MYSVADDIGSSAYYSDMIEQDGKWVCGWRDCTLMSESRTKICQHVEEVHVMQQRRAKRTNGAKGFVCRWEQCPRSNTVFHAVSNLIEHIRNHHTSYHPLKCDTCHQRIVSLNALAKHVSKYHKELQPADSFRTSFTVERESERERASPLTRTLSLQ